MRTSVTEALRLNIVNGTLQPGSRVSEDWVASEMGISRGPVREALRELENEGLLEIKAYRGTFFKEITTDEIRNILIPIRFILESRACVLALPTMTEANFQILADIIGRMGVVVTAGGEDALLKLVELDVQYHHFLMSLSSQYHALQLWKAIEPRIRIGFYRLGLKHVDFQEIVLEHQVLLDSFRTRDLKVALKALEHHICTGQFKLLDKV